MYNLLFTSLTVSYIGCCDVDITYWKILQSTSFRWLTRIRDKFLKKKKKEDQSELARKISDKSAKTSNSNFSRTTSYFRDDSVFDESFINCKKLHVRKYIKRHFQELFYIS